MGAFRQYNLGTFWSNYSYFRKKRSGFIGQILFCKNVGVPHRLLVLPVACWSVDKIAGCFDPLTLQKTTRPEWSQYSKFVATYIINLFCFMVSWLQAILEGFHKKGVFLILVPALSHPLSFLVVYLYYIGRAHIDSIYILNSNKLDNSNKNVVFMKKTSLFILKNAPWWDDYVSSKAENRNISHYYVRQRISRRRDDLY